MFYFFSFIFFYLRKKEADRELQIAHNRLKEHSEKTGFTYPCPCNKCYLKERDV